nr:hypothetical protein [Vibrio toranzoniae]
MKKLCPICQTEMLERSHIYACPRNDIGDCSYDALTAVNEESSFLFDQTNSHTDMRSYVVFDSK